MKVTNNNQPAFDLDNDFEETGKNTKAFFVGGTFNKALQEGAKKPDPKSIFYDYLFENELCLLFSDTGKGKTILSVQIAKRFCEIFPNEKALWFDFELDAKNHEMRYRTDTKELFQFPNNLLRFEINLDKLNLSITPEIVLLEIEKLIKKENAKFVIIDNLTYLEDQLHKPDKASVLVKKLLGIKKSLNITLLALSHTPKRDESKPITSNSMSGSQMLGNFIENQFAIGTSSKDRNLRYLKRVKRRNESKEIENVEIRLFKVKHSDEGYLHFEYIEDGNEFEHLKEYSKDNRDDQILQLRKEQKSVRDISKQLGISIGTVSNVINKSGKV